ncbi:ThiF family adenylyltransferase [Desulfurobacterium atlanticum]|uniref:Predicted dinucleotide-utilizing enzyme of the ThiF/HesA family n=1 Tax=Desulfurobacterium atlanticum TaxID=240169 RepID=A0A239A3V5_9BACT|nr:ThiF family adenylyltransferase [Desulfurobacterium atlanticum]SNR90325.1 Predicted dinucleotide-utilizing enzyme of the ThiF/HesA family [Desulfurobacterium atlanticum]
MDKVELLERTLIPSGKIVFLGAGRLGIRVFERILMTHRGGFRHIVIYDGGTIEENDYYHIEKGAIPKENKASFLKRKFLTPDTKYKEIEAYPFNFSAENLKELKGADIVVSTIAGGNTLPLISEIIKFCHKLEIPFITTNGVFGFGDEKIGVYRGLSSVEKGPALFLKKFNLPENLKNVLFIGTGILIKEKLPISSVILDRIADTMAVEILREFYRRKK